MILKNKNALLQIPLFSTMYYILIGFKYYLLTRIMKPTVKPTSSPVHDQLWVKPPMLLLSVMNLVLLLFYD